MSAGPKTKTCPDCAEQVNAAARICRHCRFEFAHEQSSAADGAEAVEEETPPSLMAAKIYAEHGCNTAVFGLMGLELRDCEQAYEKHRATIALLGLNADRVTSLSQVPAIATSPRRTVRVVRVFEGAGKSPAELCQEELQREEMARKQWLAENPKKPGLATRMLKGAANAAGAVLHEVYAELNRPPEEDRPLTRSERKSLERDIERHVRNAETGRRNGSSMVGYDEGRAAALSARLANGRK